MSNNTYDCATECPLTADQWWSLVNKYKEQLRNLTAEFHPSNARWAQPMNITAAAAEAVSESIREDIEREQQEDPLTSFDRMVAAKDRTLARLLNQVWFGVPESRDAHDLTGFHLLCDLCSESWVLYGDDELRWEN